MSSGRGRRVTGRLDYKVYSETGKKVRKEQKELDRITQGFENLSVMASRKLIEKDTKVCSALDRFVESNTFEVLCDTESLEAAIIECKTLYESYENIYIELKSELEEEYEETFKEFAITKKVFADWIKGAKIEVQRRKVEGRLSADAERLRIEEKDEMLKLRLIEKDERLKREEQLKTEQNKEKINSFKGILENIIERGNILTAKCNVPLISLSDSEILEKDKEAKEFDNEFTEILDRITELKKVRPPNYETAEENLNSASTIKNNLKPLIRTFKDSLKQEIASRDLSDEKIKKCVYFKN